MKIFKQNVAARAVKMLSFGVLSVLLLSCEKSAVEPFAELSLSNRTTDMRPRELGGSDLYFLRFIGIDRLSKISGADGDTPKFSDIKELPEKNNILGHWDLLAIDKVKDQLYYFTGTSPVRLMRVNIDGTNFTKLSDFPSNGGERPASLKCDGKNLYWIEPIEVAFSAQIVKADLNGLNRKVIYKGHPFAMTLDTVNGKIYFYDKLYNAVCTVDPNGFGLKIVIKNAHIYEAGALVVDPAVKKAYWISSFNDIRSANLDGTNYKILLQANTFIKSTHSARQIILDKSGNYLFYKFDNFENFKKPLYRIRIDGSEQPKLLLDDSFATIPGMVLR